MERYALDRRTIDRHWIDGHEIIRYILAHIDRLTEKKVSAHTVVYNDTCPVSILIKKDCEASLACACFSLIVYRGACAPSVRALAITKSPASLQLSGDLQTKESVHRGWAPRSRRDDRA